MTRRLFSRGGISGGLAHPRHFVAPRASYEDVEEADLEFVVRFDDDVFAGRTQFSPFDVVAW